ncbi:FxsA family protein [Paludibacterium sp.]|uniref:FxsA family protein n=1 Tax=Paludibacterium sp. TaxID=1917523 RepID=UPI0025E3CF33|nr:FxsA family protein [Paludibacterium sp.]MBV8648565.1 FxsA family protein [Paludibacterium sp.]
MPIFLFILLLPIIEILLLVQLAGHIGFLGTLLYLILSAMLGSWMLRHQKVGALLALGSVLRHGEGTSIYSLLWPLRYALAGVLFIIPGVLSEIAALMLLLPLKGPKLSGRAEAQTPPADDHVFEGEFHRVDDPAGQLGRAPRDD